MRRRSGFWGICQGTFWVLTTGFITRGSNLSPIFVISFAKALLLAFFFGRVVRYIAAKSTPTDVLQKHRLRPIKKHICIPLSSIQRHMEFRRVAQLLSSQILAELTIVCSII